MNTGGPRRLARRCVWASLVFLGCAATVSCSSLKLGRDANPRPGDWLQEGSSSGHQYYAEGAVRPPLELAWMYNAGAAFGPGSPVVAGEVVVVGTRNGKVHAVRIEGGKKAGVDGFGSNVNGSLAVGEATFFIPIAWGRPTGLVAHDPISGAARWTHRTAPVESGIVLFGDRVLFVDSTPTVFCVSAEDGVVIWDYPLDDRSAIRVTPTIVEDLLVVASDKGALTAIDILTGTQIWRVETGLPVYGSPASSGSTLFVPTARGRLLAIDAADGDTRWEASTDPGIRFASPAVSGDGGVAFGASDGRTWFVDASTGRIIWTHDGGSAITAAPLVTPEHVFVGTMDKRLVALDRRTGRSVWDTTLKGRVKSGMAVKGESLFVLSEPRYVYHFRPAEVETDG